MASSGHRGILVAESKRAAMQARQIVPGTAIRELNRCLWQERSAGTHLVEVVLLRAACKKYQQEVPVSSHDVRTSRHTSRYQ